MTTPPKTIVFLLLSLLTGCTSTQVVNQDSVKSAILVEGLASYSLGHVRNQFKTPLEKLGYAVYSEPYTTTRVIKADVCIGHSFGGGTVISKFKDCKLLITMDARSWQSSNNDKYVSPCLNKECVHYNYWEDQSALRGYSVTGAINEKVKCTHTKMPVCLKDKVLAIIKGI